MGVAHDLAGFAQQQVAALFVAAPGQMQQDVLRQRWGSVGGGHPLHPQLDVDSIERVYRHFHGRVRMSFGWGTNLTNDFRDCDPDGAAGLEPISLVAKVTRANGRPAVKLSDNPAKATGDPAEIARYLGIFGEAGRRQGAVEV